jgi:hypothetical protein
MDYFLKFIITDEDLNSKKMCYPPDSFTIFPENHFILPLTNIKYKSFNSNFNANVKYANEVFIFRCRVTFLPVKAKLYEFPNLHLKTHVGDENYIRYRSEVKLNYLPKGLDYGGYYLTVERKVLYNYIYNITDIIPLSKAEIRQVLENDASLNTLQLRILKKWNPSIFN